MEVVMTPNEEFTEMHSQNTRLFNLLILLLFMFAFASTGFAAENRLKVSGDVLKNQNLSLTDIRQLPSFYIKDVTCIAEKTDCSAKEEKRLSVDTFRGVLLRDILDLAGMKHRVKWEPGVYFLVHGTDGRTAVFSFGEIYYSSIGRSVLLAYEKNGEPIESQNGCAQLIVSTDIRSGRWVPEISEIAVKRVDVELEAYEDKKQKRVRPPVESLIIVDQDIGRSMEIDLGKISVLPPVSISEAVMTGDCEGFHGVYSFDGPSLRSVLGLFASPGCPPPYDRFVLLSSSDGFCATFSYGEIFNSRLGENIILAIKKDGRMLEEKDGFTRSVVREDSTGGRSVKRISKIEIITSTKTK
ncbi:MAG: hypothetical protein C4518_01330 [Desulfobacteraceae bacterium]|nr:MAG: hypothetical protein C4518_01330 [Desulfobacteraceae bacterium]